jgi:hypothetical protein
MFFWSAGQTGFYGTIRKISGRDIRDRDNKKIYPAGRARWALPAGLPLNTLGRFLVFFKVFYEIGFSTLS